MMSGAVSEYGLTATASVTASASANEKISRNNIQVKHIRIDSDKSYGGRKICSSSWSNGQVKSSARLN